MTGACQLGFSRRNEIYDAAANLAIAVAHINQSIPQGSFPHARINVEHPRPEAQRPQTLAELLADCLELP